MAIKRSNADMLLLGVEKDSHAGYYLLRLHVLVLAPTMKILQEEQLASTTKLSMRTRKMKSRSSLVSRLQNSRTVPSSLFARADLVKRSLPNTFVHALQRAEKALVASAIWC